MEQALMRALIRRIQLKRDKGSAMIVTLLSFLITAGVLIGSLGFVSHSTKFSRYEQDAELAQTAAEAGLNDILSELRADAEYFENLTLNTANATGYCFKQAVGGPAAEGDVFASDCGWPAAMAPRWQRLGGDDGGDYQEYHYAVTEYSVMSQYIDVVSTGRSRDVYRSVKATIVRETAQRWSYMLNYFLVDPRMYSSGEFYGDAVTSSGCGGGWAKGVTLPDFGYSWASPAPVRRYQYRNASGGVSWASCRPYAYTGLKGGAGAPMHSNDTFYVVAQTENGEMTTSDPLCKTADPANQATWKRCVGNRSNAPTVWNAPMPTYREVLELPTVGDPKAWSIAGFGCRYEGPTRIILQGSSMQVWSKHTVTERPGCGSIADLTSPSGATVAIPADGLVFVDAAPGVTPVEIAAGAIGGPTGRELPLGTYPGGAPTSVGQTYIGEVEMSKPHLYDGIGNIFVEGILSGGNRLTIAADRDIVITGDLVTGDTSNDIIGVMAGAGVEIQNALMHVVQSVKDSSGNLVWKPLTNWDLDPIPSPIVGGTYAEGWPTNYWGASTILRIEAVIYAATYSFRTQHSYVLRNNPTMYIEVYGSVTENFIGDHGWTWTGFSVPFTGWRVNQYVYNPALSTSKPLLFPAFGNGTWLVNWQEKTTTPEILKSS
ncbi:MAG: hypothetical protein LBE08_11015 [Bifidobacteriaceae bacterium]|jgi:Tfp pilus assembly protein PilX|nr:hypothetical protein [Bifidobacteriaceae bacterium]